MGRLGVKPLCLQSSNARPLWRSATVSQTSRSRVASEKSYRADQALCMANVPATGFQHSRAPVESKETSPQNNESPEWAIPLAERDCVGDQSQMRGQPDG